MCHLELSVDAEELAAMEQAQAEMDIQETRMDPAFANGDTAMAGELDVHPAAEMQRRAQPRRCLPILTRRMPLPRGN